MIMAIVGTILLSFFNNELVWVLVIMVGFTRLACATLIIVMVMETKGVGVAYAGTALGLMMTLGRISAVASPPIGNSLASISMGTPFIFWAALAALGLVILSFTKETGWRVGQKEN